MLKGAQGQIKIVSVASKLSHWDLWLKCDKQDNNLQEYPNLDADIRLQCTEQDNYLLEYPDLEAVLRLKSNEQDMQEYTDLVDLRLTSKEQDNHLQEYLDVGADMQEYTDLVDLRLKSNEQDNHLQEYIDVGADMQEYTEEGNNLEEYSEEYDETNVEERILPELQTVRQHIKVKIELNEELDSSDNLTQVKEEVLSDIDIDDTTHFSDLNERVKEELNESQQYESTYSIFDDIDDSKNVDAIAKYFDKVDIVPKHYKKVKNSLKTVIKVDEVQKSSKDDAISGTELSTVKCNVCLKGFLGDETYNKHMKNHTTKDISPAEVIPSKKVVVGNPLANKWAMVKFKKNRVKRLAKAKSNENKTTKTYFTRSSVKNIVVKENKDLLIEIPGKTKVVKLLKGKSKQPEERSNRLYDHHYNVTYKVWDESCTNKKFVTQSKECRSEQKTKQEINMRFACTQCDYKVNWKRHLDRHILLTHKGGKNHHCNLCDYICFQRYHLDQHMRTHSKTKPYSCNFCNYNCVQQSQLDQHMRRHTGVKPFSCNICEYTCTQRGHLDQHMRRHTGVKPFSCNICEYTCTQRCHLDQHMRIHTGIRPFLCIHCDYKFVQQSHLNQHIMKMHKNVQLYECSDCRYRCLKLDLLARHMKIHCVSTT